jgi:hypothetical protein
VTENFREINVIFGISEGQAFVNRRDSTGHEKALYQRSDKVKLFVYFVCEVGSWGRIEFTIEDVMHPCDRRSAELFLLRKMLVSSVDPAFLPARSPWAVEGFGNGYAVAPLARSARSECTRIGLGLR